MHGVLLAGWILLQGRFYIVVLNVEPIFLFLSIAVSRHRIVDKGPTVLKYTPCAAYRKPVSAQRHAFDSLVNVAK